MDVRECLTIRRVYALVRQGQPSSERLTFEEYAILAKLDAADAPMLTSEVADWQNSLRPTMTHRTNRLSSHGLISRSEGSADRRNVLCALTDKGRACLADLTNQMRDRLRQGDVLNRIGPERVLKYIIALGPVFLRAQDLVVVALYKSGRGEATVSEMVAALGLLQPTVSMSVASLETDGMVERVERSGRAGQLSVALTQTGEAAAREVEKRISEVIVTRKPRKAS